MWTDVSCCIVHARSHTWALNLIPTGAFLVAPSAPKKVVLEVLSTWFPLVESWEKVFARHRKKFFTLLAKVRVVPRRVIDRLRPGNRQRPAVCLMVRQKAFVKFAISLTRCTHGVIFLTAYLSPRSAWGPRYGKRRSDGLRGFFLWQFDN